MSLRGIGPSLALQLREQHSEASGQELIANNLWTAAEWSGAGSAWAATGWTKTSPDTAANHIEPGAGGSGIRIVSDGTYVGVGQVATTTNHTYQYKIVVSAVASGTIALAGLGNYLLIAAPGTYTGTFVADTTSVVIKRNVACDATITFVSVQEILTVTWDSSEYVSADTFLGSNRGGAQECISIVKLEQVDRHTGVVTTVADFSNSPGAGAVYTLPTGWVYNCPTAGRTTQTSASTLVTAIAANAAPAKSVTGAPGSFGLGVESQRTNAGLVSENLGGWSVNAGGSATDINGHVAPDGANTADKCNWVASPISGLGQQSFAAGQAGYVSGWILQSGVTAQIDLVDGATGGSLGSFVPTAAWQRAGAIRTSILAGGMYWGRLNAIPAGAAWVWGGQLEPGAVKYPSSYIPTAATAVTRAAATLTCPQDDCNTFSGRIPRITIQPHFAYNETLLDCTIIDDSRGHLFYEQSTQKFVYEVRGKGRIASLACTFSRDQQIVLQADLDEASLLMSLSVAGVSSGAGLYQTTAAPKRLVLVGDGYTASYMPAQLLPNGETFALVDIHQSLQTPERGQPMGDNGSAFVLVNVPPALLAVSISHLVFGHMRLGADYPTGWVVVLYDTRLIVYWGGGSAIITTAAGAVTPGWHSVAVSNTAGQVSVYVDARLVGGPVSTSGPDVNMQGYLIGGQPAGVNMAPLYGAQIKKPTFSSLAMTAQQIRILHEAAMKDLSC